ncbi:MAG: hypothetical protein ACXVCY_08085 [Pseudobdellovibrionaceae bacterium]
MKKQILVSLILAGTMVSGAHAEEQKNQKTNTSTVKVSDVQKSDEQQKSDLDSEITNARMRAEAGSKSKWSVKANLAYQGGSVEKPFDKERPNYRKGTTGQALTYLSGTVGMAYRATDKDAIRVGTGITMLTPLHNNLDDLKSNQLGDSHDTKVLNVSTPYIEYSRSFRAGNIMHMPSLSYSHATEQYDTDVLKNIGTVSLAHTMVADIAGSNFQPGVSIATDYTLFKDDPQAIDVMNRKGARIDYDLGVYPFLEYSFNDRYSFRTVFGYFSYAHYRNDEASSLQRLASYQSMGVGVAVTREIYLYPNVQFIPDDIRSDRTNVGLSSTLNVF